MSNDDQQWAADTGAQHPEPYGPPPAGQYGQPQPQPYQPSGPQGQYGNPAETGTPAGYGSYDQQPYAQPYPPMGYPYPPNDGQATAAMVLGIVGLVGACLYGVSLMLSPVAMVMGRSAQKRIQRSQGQLGGEGMAQAGFILGIIGTVLLVLSIIAVVLLVFVLVAADSSGNV